MRFVPRLPSRSVNRHVGIVAHAAGRAAPRAQAVKLAPHFVVRVAPPNVIAVVVVLAGTVALHAPHGAVFSHSIGLSDSIWQAMQTIAPSS